jgi:hypothetical protein
MSSPLDNIASSASDAGNDIVFSDPSEPFVVKPFIEDLLRTQYCIPGSVFLVEGIDRISPIRRRFRAIRLLVSDGISCVQGVLKPESHGLVDSGLIYAGCYVRVDGFELRFLDVAHRAEEHGREGNRDGGVSDGKNETQGSRHGQMVYLVLENPVTVGWNTAYLRLLESRKQASPQGLNQEPEPDAKGNATVAFPAEEESVPTALAGQALSNNIATNPKTSHGYGGITDTDLEALDFPETDKPEPGLNIAMPSERPPTSNIHQPSSEQLPWSTNDPTKPMKLTPLRMIPNLPYKQNWMVNVLAVVASISDVEPSHLPPYHQRTARLADPSTDKQVLLTVFLDPDDFNPAIGSVVLILGIKNHRFDGGSLKKYASDRPKNGARWWFEEPNELGWCDVSGLRAWWDRKQADG